MYQDLRKVKDVSLRVLRKSYVYNVELREEIPHCSDRILVIEYCFCDSGGILFFIANFVSNSLKLAASFDL
jgi:hypothetical protein